MGGRSSKSSYQEVIEEHLRVRGAALLPLPSGGELIDESKVEPCPSGHHAIRRMPDVVFASGKEMITVKAFFCQRDLTQYISGTEVCGQPCTNSTCPSASLPHDSFDRFLCFHSYGHNTDQTPHCCVNCPGRNGIVGHVRMPFNLIMQDNCEYNQRVVDQSRQGVDFQIQSLDLLTNMANILTSPDSGPLTSQQLQLLTTQSRQITQLANQQSSIIEARQQSIIQATIPFTELFLHVKTFQLTNETLTNIQIEEIRKRGFFSSSKSRSEKVIVTDDASRREVQMSIPVTITGGRIYLTIDRQLYQQGIVDVITKSPTNQIQVVNNLSIDPPPGYAVNIVNYRNSPPCQRGQHMGALVPISAMIYQYYERIVHVNGSLREHVEQQLGAKVSVISCVLCGRSTCLLFNSTVLKNLPRVIAQLLAQQNQVSVTFR